MTDAIKQQNTDNSAQWGTIWAAVIGAIGVVTAAFAPNYFKERRRKANESTYVDGLQKIIDFNRELSSLEVHGAERAILFFGHNCGGYPSPGKPYFVSATQRHVAQGHDGQVIDNYNDLLVDNEYVQMLMNAYSATMQYVYMETEKMPPCQLRRYYEAEGVTASAVFVLGIDDKNLYFLSAARYSGTFTEKQLTSIHLAVHRLWGKMKAKK